MIITIIIYLFIYLFLASSSHHPQLDVFHWGLRDSKSLLVTRTLLSLLVDFKNSVIWTGSILPPFFFHSSLFSKPLRTISSPLTSIGITITLTFHIFFSLLARSEYFVCFSIIILIIHMIWNIYELQLTGFLIRLRFIPFKGKGFHQIRTIEYLWTWSIHTWVTIW